jgi:anti-anti-sigma factor
MLSLHGEFDFATLPQVREALIRVCSEPGSDLLVDFHEVTFCSAGLLGLLATTAARMRGHGFRLRVLRVEPAQKRLFHLSGLSHLLDRD